MGITGQISIARVGQSVEVFQEEEDIVDVFDPNTQPVLQAGDHVALYPGDFQPALSSDPITIPNDVFVTILPGALVGYNTIDGPLSNRYTYISGAIENIADLNIADQYATEIEKQGPRIRRYPADGQGPAGEDIPFFGHQTLGEAAVNSDPGDSVVVFPGEYEVDSNLFVDGLTWFFMEGSVVEYNVDFSTTYPHAMFDDLKANDGTVSIGGKETQILGKGEFIVSPPSEQPVGGFDPGTVSNADWDSWHMYSILGINDDDTRVDFRAQRVVMDGFADAAFKITGGDLVNIEIDEFVFESTLEEINNIPPQARTPSGLIFNGIDGSISSDPGQIDVDIGRVLVNFDGTILTGHIASGINHDTASRSIFTGDIDLTTPDIQADTNSAIERLFWFGDANDGKLVFEGVGNDGNSGGLFYEGTGSNTSDLILKDTTFDAGNSTRPPVSLEGSPSLFALKMSGVWLLTGENVNFDDVDAITTFSIVDNTTSGAVDIQVYESSFADAPIENFEDNLDDELNNIVWSSSVSSIE